MESLFVNSALVPAGAALVASPIIIHLINRMRFRRVRFAAMEFLLQAQQKNRRRILIEQLLLLLLRILIVLAIMLLIARFIWSSSQLALLRGQAQSHHVILIDDSGSMREINGQEKESAFKQAKDIVAKLSQKGTDEPGTQKFTILLLSKPKSALFTEEESNLDFSKRVIAKLRNVECSHQKLSLAEGLAIAGQALTGDKDDDTIIKNLHVVSDFRIEDWKNEDAIVKSVEELTDKDISVNFIKTIKDGLPNLAVTDLTGELQVATAGVPIRLQASVTNYGTTEAKSKSLRIIVDGTAISRVVQFESIGAGKTVTKHFDVTFATAGSHRLRVKLPSDSMPEDNQRYLAIESLPRFNKVLLIDGNQIEDEVLDIRDALSADSKITGIQVQIEKPDWLHQNPLAPFKCIYMLNVTQIPEDAISPIEEYVRAGGGLVWFMGKSINADFYNTKLYRLSVTKDKDDRDVSRVTGLFPVPLGNGSTTLQKLPNAKTGQDVQIPRKHPVFDTLVAIDAIQLFELKEYYPVSTDPFGEKKIVWRRDDNLRNDGVSTLAVVQTQEPLFLEHRLGKGRIVTCLSTAGSAWANWGPDGIYAPFQLGLSQHISRRAPDKQRIVGAAIEERVAAALYEKDVEFGAPGQDRKMVPFAASTKSEKRPPKTEGGAEETVDFHEVAISDTDRPGIYRIKFSPKRGGAASQSGSKELRMFAYNMPNEESAVAVKGIETLKSAFDKNEAVSVYAAEDETPFKGKAPGEDIRVIIMFALVFLLLAEQLLAYRLSYHAHAALPV